MFIVYIFICIFKYIHVCIPFCTSLMDVPHLSLAENQYQHPSTPHKRSGHGKLVFPSTVFVGPRVDTCRYPSAFFCSEKWGWNWYVTIYSTSLVWRQPGGEFGLLIKGCNLGSLDKPGQRTTSLQMIGDRIFFVGAGWVFLGESSWNKTFT